MNSQTERVTNKLEQVKANMAYVQLMFTNDIPKAIHGCNNCTNTYVIVNIT